MNDQVNVSHTVTASTNTDRFQVGETIVAVHYGYESKFMTGFMRPFVSDVTQPEKINFIKLKVIGRYPVPWDQDPEQRLDHVGFVLEDEMGRRWFNQYPRASFGQLDDSQNFMFVRENLDGKEGLEKRYYLQNEDPYRAQLLTSSLEHYYDIWMDKSDPPRFCSDTRQRAGRFYRRISDELKMKYPGACLVTDSSMHQEYGIVKIDVVFPK